MVKYKSRSKLDRDKKTKRVHKFDQRMNDDHFHFERVFGLKKPAQDGPPFVRDGDHEWYGLAAYGDWLSDGESFWRYSVGKFDYIWGRYEGVVDHSKGIALYLVAIEKDNIEKIALVDKLHFTTEEAQRYDPNCKHDLTLGALIEVPHLIELVDPVDFNEL
jgi:hypothetical protein